jgi:hypothetical protein
MKMFIALVCAVWTLHAGFFDGASREDRQQQRQQMQLFDRFKANAREANAIVKRGEYDLMLRQKREIARISQEIASLEMSAQEQSALNGDLKEYEELVSRIGTQLKLKAPELNTHYKQVLDGLPNFNKKLGSIGLRELLHSWRELSRIKSRFVKRPSSKLVRAFEKEWTNVTVTITELYLDEEMEQPLFDYLESYKAYFNEINSAYRIAGYDNVARLKPLTYQIKMHFEMLTPKLAANN